MDVEIFKTNIMQTCPNCRCTYQTELHTTCPTCYQIESLSSRFMPVVSSKRPHPSTSYLNSTNCVVSLHDLEHMREDNYRWRKFLCGGSMTNHAEASEPDHLQLKPLKPPNILAKSGNSPTESLSFFLSTTPAVLISRETGYDDNQQYGSFFGKPDDIVRISNSQRLLELSGWYHKGLLWKDAIELLMPTPVGTFLIRNSSDSKYLYSLSVQTKCGPTSIRIHYLNGNFRLDADNKVAELMPRYPCIIKLIQSYVESTRNQPLKCSLENENPAWLSLVGKIYSQIVLTKPVYKKGHVPSLKHLSRLIVNQNLVDPNDPNSRNLLVAPPDVISYLNEYPYKY